MNEIADQTRPPDNLRGVLVPGDDVGGDQKMEGELSKLCLECHGKMIAITLWDGSGILLQQHQLGDRQNFWTGGYQTGGTVKSLMCEDCHRIALYGEFKQT